MTQFHSDEYVKFLKRVTPANMGSFVKEQHKCAWPFSEPPVYIKLKCRLKIMLEMTVPFLTACSTTAPSLLVARWVCTRFNLLFLRHNGLDIEGAARLSRDKCDIAVNWAGGLHHAKKSEASGFCYVNGAWFLAVFSFVQG